MGLFAWLAKAVTREELPPGADGRLGPRDVQALFANNTVFMSVACDVTFHPDGRAEWKLFDPDQRDHGADGVYSINRFDGEVRLRLNTPYGSDRHTLILARRDGRLLANDRIDVILRPA
jgi:hypothetical protein